jgi:hypothetical protein
VDDTISRDIPGFPSRYKATSDGRIIRLAWTYETTCWGSKTTRPMKAKTLCGTKLSPKGYARVNLCKKVYFAHRLVALAFIPNPLNLPQINHKNGIKTDNRPDNLEWASNIDNRIHAVALGLIARGESVGNAKLTEGDVLRIRDLAAAGVFQRVIATAHGIGQQNVSSIVKRQSWKHI